MTDTSEKIRLAEAEVARLKERAEKEIVEKAHIEEEKIIKSAKTAGITEVLKNLGMSIVEDDPNRGERYDYPFRNYGVTYTRFYWPGESPRTEEDGIGGFYAVSELSSLPYAESNHSHNKVEPGIYKVSHSSWLDRSRYFEPDRPIYYYCNALKFSDVSNLDLVRTEIIAFVHSHMNEELNNAKNRVEAAIKNVLNIEKRIENFNEQIMKRT